MKNENIKKSLNPIINDNSKILILGSLPSDKSIFMNEYYGNTSNQFWDIISSVFEKQKIKFENYNEKINFLNKQDIALWDVYCSAERIGSLDTNIKNGNFNNIKELLNTYTNIHTLLVNGKAAETAFKQYMKNQQLHYKYKYVPSSSSANTRYTLSEKIEFWRNAIET